MGDDFLDYISKVSDAPADVKKALDDSALSAEEKARVVDAWEQGMRRVKDIVVYACGPEYDGRSSKGIQVKAILSEQGNTPIPGNIKVKKTGEISLSAENLEFIKNNPTMKPLEAARLIFKDQKLTYLSAQCRVVTAEYDKLAGGNGEDAAKTYKQPRDEREAITRINTYKANALEPGKLTPTQRECVKRLREYLGNYRFTREYDEIANAADKKLFESQFILFTHNKSDLTAEEVDSYITVAVECVQLQKYKREEEELIQISNDARAEDQSASYTLIEQLNKLRATQHDTKKHIENLLKGLNGTRAQRMKNVTDNSNTVLNLLEAYRDAQKRTKLLELAQMRKDDVSEEAVRLREIDELQFQIFGVSKEEVT